MFYRIIFYSRKFSNSSIKQNSPNVLFTVKKFKLLRLGAVDRTWTCMVAHKILSLACLPIPPRPHIISGAEGGTLVSHGIATAGFWVHSSYLLVPKVGLEPTRYRYHRILSPARLPFHHFGIKGGDAHRLLSVTSNRIAYFKEFDKRMKPDF